MDDKIFQYDSKIMSLNDKVDDYDFQVVCNEKDLISIGNELENFVRDCHEDFWNKKIIIVAVRKNNRLIASVKINIQDYITNFRGYRDEFPLYYDDQIVLENWGEKNNLKFLFPTQREIDELLRGSE